jgi:hypothetical protein
VGILWRWISVRGIFCMGMELWRRGSVDFWGSVLIRRDWFVLERMNRLVCYSIECNQIMISHLFHIIWLYYLLKLSFNMILHNIYNINDRINGKTKIK